MRDLAPIKKFLESNPDEFGLMEALELIFCHAEIAESKNKLGKTYRRYCFVLPDSLFFNYGRNFRSCSITESTYQEETCVRVYYGTIDDAAMNATIYVKNEDDMRKVFDKLVQILHVEKDHPKNIIGFSYVNFYPKFEGYPELLIQWESDFNTLLEEHIRPLCSYHVVYDYN